MKLNDIAANIVVQFFVNFDRFMKSKIPNLWICSDNNEVQIYCRKAMHFIDDQRESCLDIANIRIDDAFQNQGIGTTIINRIHELNPYGVTLIESILNKALYDRLKKQGWIDIPDSLPPSVYKRTGKL